MVTLTNVKKQNNILTTEYYPEGNKSDIGRIEFDVQSKKAINIQYCKEDEESFLKRYANKAVDAIEEMIAKNEYPKTYEYMWY